MRDEPLSQEERIAAQRVRIKQRMASPNDASNTSPADRNDEGLSTIPVARTATLDVLHHMSENYSASVSAVTGIVGLAKVHENQRRFNDEEVMERLKELGTADDIEAEHGALRLRFEALYEHKIPHTLHNGLKEQQQQCSSLLQKKDMLIGELQQQLQHKEDEYVTLLRNSTQEVNDIVVTMRASTDAYLREYTSRLEATEKELEVDRQGFLDNCAANVQQLVKTRRAKELEYRRRRETKRTEAQQKLDAKYESGYEEYNETKRGHQTDVHSLREELEKSKADFLLNGERLTYNLQVLRERVKENRNAQAQYKKKIARLQDTLANLVSRYHEAERKCQRVNKELTAQLHRSERQYKDTKVKFASFEATDKKKYKQLWEMHNDKCQTLAQECLQADRVVFEELLRMPWQPPQLRYWPKEQADVEELEEDKPDDIPDVELTEAAQMLFHILKLQAPFLIDDYIKTAISAIEGTSDEQADVEGILSTLQIRKTEEVENLLEFFIVENEDETVALINPQEALQALKLFLEERARRATKEMEASMAAKLNGSNSEKTKKRGRDAHRRAAEREYWHNISHSVPKDHLEVWESLEDGLEKYLTELRKRKHLIGVTDTLRAQNDDLKGLISQYAHSNINYELYEPPRLVSTTRADSYPS